MLVSLEQVKMAFGHKVSLVAILSLTFVSVLVTMALSYQILNGKERTSTVPRFEVVREYGHERDSDGGEVPSSVNRTKQASKTDVISALNKRWMTWQTIDSPGKYRACVPHPKPDNMFDRELSGGLVDSDSNMTVTRCLHMCSSSDYTYAALTRGIQCYCTNMYRSSRLLSYVDSSLCETPCAGDRDYDCGGKTYFSLYRTSIPDPRCCQISVEAKGSLPLIALASYPRSGNTWTRQLIEFASGISTGSVYWHAEKEQDIARKVFRGGNANYKNKHTICVKSHLMETSHIHEFKGAVLLMRNPYRTLVAEVFRRLLFARSAKGSLTDGLDYFKTEEWKHFVLEQGQRWHEMNKQWITESKRLLVVHYECLESETERQLARIIEFLKRPVDEERLACAVQENPSSLSTGIALGNHGVKTRAYLTKDPFTRSMHTMLDAYIEDVNRSLVTSGQDPIPGYYKNIKVY